MKTTIHNIENAFSHLQRLLPEHKLALEWYGRKCRVMGRDYTTPFSSNYYSKSQMYDILWFAVGVLRMKEDRL